MKTLKTTVMIIAAAAMLSGAAKAEDFWRIYGEKAVYNYSVKVGAIPEFAGSIPSNRLSNDDVASIITKTLSQTLAVRFQQVYDKKRSAAVVCIFTPQPERCFFENIINTVFDEIHVVNAPGLSNKFFKKATRYYSATSGRDESRFDNMSRAAAGVPARKKFNPRFSINVKEPEFVVSTPFHSFFGTYVEPKFGSKTGPALSLIVDKYFVDFEKEGVVVRYHVKNRESAKGYLSVSIRPEGEIYVTNEFMFK